mmetsp:Transcript_20149/g.30653  ORF Transcript_20149/g.30653 Transcript_20149/m.30653 type:complete len:401 (+) Transcript_20149:180-1382(+)
MVGYNNDENDSDSQETYQEMTTSLQNRHDRALLPGDPLNTPFGNGRFIEVRPHDCVCVIALSFGVLYAPTAETPKAMMNSNQEEEEEEATNNNTGGKQGPLTAMDIARKAAVGVVGGTMTAVGLVMIPLPTPFGAVIATSGIAVLGTEFEQAHVVNQRMMDATLPIIDNCKATIHKKVNAARKSFHEETWKRKQQTRPNEKSQAENEQQQKENHEYIEMDDFCPKTVSSEDYDDDDDDDEAGGGTSTTHTTSTATTTSSQEDDTANQDENENDTQNESKLFVYWQLDEEHFEKEKEYTCNNNSNEADLFGYTPLAEGGGGGAIIMNAKERRRQAMLKEQEQLSVSLLEAQRFVKKQTKQFLNAFSTIRKQQEEDDQDDQQHESMLEQQPKRRPFQFFSQV